MKWTKELLIKFEEQVAEAFKAGELSCPIHLSGGNEDELIALFTSIKKKDFVFSTHRNHYHYLLKGGNELGLLWELRGMENGICGGQARSMHIIDESINFYSSGIVGGMVAPACGVALAIKKRYKGKDKKPHVWCFVGDGAEDGGHFMEAARFADARRLPLTFVVEDNDIAVESTRADRWHNFSPPLFKCVIRYEYKRKYPHVGVGKHVSF